MAVVGKPTEPPLIQVFDNQGRVVGGEHDPGIDGDTLKHLYRSMCRLRYLDERMLRLQRQGRLGFYMTSTGEEAAQFGSAWALEKDDWVFPSYREPGVALERGYGLHEFMCQLMGNAEDPLMGRQMPVHHSVDSANFVSISSPVGTQIPQAVGAARAAQIKKDKVGVITYLGEGATSTGDFHVGMNFAGVWNAPCVFFVRNNGWAISTPLSKQTGSATIAQKAHAYGFRGIKVDGNDILAVAQVTKDAMDRARNGDGPTLIEACTYRSGAHSSSDDPSAYRDPEEPKRWEKRDPIKRFRKYLHGRKLWAEKWQKTIDAELKEEIDAALAAADAVAKKPPVETLFTDVYADMPWHIREQQEALLDYLGRKGPVGGHH